MLSCEQVETDKTDYAVKEDAEFYPSDRTEEQYEGRLKGYDRDLRVGKLDRTAAFVWVPERKLMIIEQGNPGGFRPGEILIPVLYPQMIA